MQRREFALALAAAASAAIVPAWAQATVRRIVVGFPAGGSVDLVARLLAEQWRQSPVNTIVDNRVGAGGRIAAENVKASPPDGLSVLLTPASMMVIYPHIYRQLRYEPPKDFVPVSRVVNYDFGFAVGPAAGAPTKLGEFLAWAKANAAKAAFASPAAGSAPHFLGTMLAEAAATPMLHVAYRGTAPAVTDVIGGNIASIFTVFGDLVPHHKAGKLRILAMTGRNRSELLPDVPTFTELGFASLEFSEWYGLFAPANTPARIVDELQKATTEAMRVPSVVNRLAELGFQSSPSSSEELRTQVLADTARWSAIVKKSGFVAEE